MSWRDWLASWLWDGCAREQQEAEMLRARLTRIEAQWWLDRALKRQAQKQKAATNVRPFQRKSG